jgi:hypothetical protein
VRIDPVIAKSPIHIAASPDLAAQLSARARGRPLVIDYFSSRHRGLSVGDMTAEFATRSLEPRYVEIEPIEGVRILVERHLIDLLANGASLTVRRRFLGWRFDVSLAQPELWLEVLESHPSRR